MSVLTWRERKKLFISVIVLGFLAVVAGLYIYFNLPEPTCFDGKLNQNEEDVDCGGVCNPCVKNPKEPVVLWTRVFKVGEGLYEPASLVENPNLFYGLPEVSYVFKLYDANNVMVAVREGKTFLNPKDRFVFLGPIIETGQRKPTRASMEIQPVSGWQFLGESKISLLVSEKKFSNEPFPVLEAQLFNQSLFPVSDIYTAAILYDENGNAAAASSGMLDNIQNESGKKITFTWPVPFDWIPASSEIFTRVNLMNGAAAAP